ncbi:MAG: Flp pilus assembly complex ATPase component, partial [Chlorobi bacterium]|nr:Flp pilus assembly complex ATPase component [Chlorobiota bacterium]
MARPEDEKLMKALLRRKLIKREDLAAMSAKARKSLATHGITKTFTTEFKLDDIALAKIIAEVFSIPFIQSSERFAAISFPEVDREFVTRYRAFPLILEKDEATVAIIDPPYEQVIEKLRKVFKRNILAVVVPLSLFETLSQRVEKKAETTKPKVPKVNLEAIDVEARGKDWADAVEKSGELPNAATVLAKILESADNLAASDIHFEVTRDGFFLVRMRVDGVMQRAVTLPRTYVESLPRIIRQSSSVDAFKKNEVQEGRLVFPLQDKKINARMNIIPTSTGERIVLRILSKQRQILSIPELGMSPQDRENLEEILESSGGVILFAGPPGCGKTMTMYAALNFLNNTSLSIATLENPVEIELDGINQISIDDLRGFNYTDLIRALMRQDVDIIGIGEIHNREEAEALIEAGSAGVTVLSTVCAKDSIEAI